MSPIGLQVFSARCAAGQASTPVVEEGTYAVYFLVTRVAPNSDDVEMRTMARDEEANDRLEVAGAGRFEDQGAW